MKFIKKSIRYFLYGKKWDQKIFKKLHRISLLGMNYGVNPKVEESGEAFLLNQLYKEAKTAKWIIFDIGANTGDYTKMLLGVFGRSALIYSKEGVLVPYINGGLTISQSK